MKLLPAIILFVFSISKLCAQEVDFKWATPEKINKKAESPELLGIKNGTAFILKSDNPKDVGSYYITTYDEKSLQAGEKIIFEQLLPKDVNENGFYGVYMLQNHMAVVSVTKNKELIASLIDYNGKVVKPKIIVDRVEGKDKTFEGFSVKISENRAVILGYRKAKGVDKKSTSFVFSTYDENIKKLNSTKVSVPYEEENIEIEKVEIDNESNVYIVADLTIEAKKKKFNIIKSVLMHLPMGTKKPELNEVALPLEKKIATSVSFILSKDKITITGMYAINKEAEKLEGIFYTEINKTSLDVLTSSYEKFKPGLQTRKAASKKLETGIDYSYKLRNIFIDGQNNKTLVFENKYDGYYTDSKGNVTKTNYDMDILVVKLTNDNKLEWNVMIFKNQLLSVPYSRAANIGIVTISSNAIYQRFKKMEDILGFSVLNINNKLYFVFNDHSENIKKKSADSPFNNNQKKSYSALVVMDLATGKWDKKALFNFKESQRIITPKNGTQISNNQLLIFGFEKKLINFGLMTIE